jgi:hypothetical protein
MARKNLLFKTSSERRAWEEGDSNKKVGLIIQLPSCHRKKFLQSLKEGKINILMRQSVEEQTDTEPSEDTDTKYDNLFI